MGLQLSPVVASGNGGGSGGSAEWGDITGTLSDQTDLQNALNAKENLAAQGEFTFADHFVSNLTNNTPWALSGWSVSGDAPPTGTQGLTRGVVPASVGNINSLRLSSTPNLKIGNGRIRVTWTWVWDAGLTSSNLSTVLQEYKLFAGLSQTATFTATEYQVGFLYDRATDGDFVTCICRNGAIGDQTKEVTTVAITSSSILNLTLDIAANGSEVLFYVNGTLVETITTNIPTTQLLTPSIFVERLVGSGSRSVYADYFNLHLNP
jgi:hypothetical protein